MKKAPAKFKFVLEGLPEEGDYFGYEDYRLAQPERGLFYIGIGERRRVRLPGRHHNRGHSNISSVHGVLRKVVKTFDSIDDMNAWEIKRIQEIRESGATLVNKADGGEGTRGLMPCRNLVTNETRVFRIDEIPEGWVHSSKGMVPCRNITTGKTTNFQKGAIPDGWQPIATGTIPCRNIITGEVKRLVVDEVPEGWEGLNKGRASYRNLSTGETAMFDADGVPEGWAHIAVGMASCRNAATGETKVFPKDAIPDGWVGQTRGMVACKSPLTGETGSFPKGMTPTGWVGMNAGNKKKDSIEAQVTENFSRHPNISRRELIDLCVAEGLSRKSVDHMCWRLKLGRTNTEFDETLPVLLAFVSEHGRLPVAKESFQGHKIGSWCNGQRQKYKKGKLSDASIQALEAVTGWWWSKWTKQ